MVIITHSNELAKEVIDSFGGSLFLAGD
jgi:hypothetical protein